ncbi:MAG: hypothetical protein JEZ02_19020 [Desulfatibacillum sp.]|nr:hypothetical protein [Desulfatibacillum sp.]
MQHLFDRYVTALSVVFLCTTAWMAHFALSGHFLLYEDDYAVMGLSLDMDLPSLMGILKALWRECPTGRPLHFTFGRIFAYLGNQAGGIQGMYWIGYTIICANTLLFYALLRKMAPLAVAFFGALCFCLFPADTTKPLLTHSLMIQPGLTFLLAALLIYTGKRPWLAYFVILGSLVTYESTALPFIMAPLLKTPWNRERFKILCRHILAIFLVLGLAGAVRLMLHESRVCDLLQYPWDAAVKALWSLVLGPLTIIWTFVLRMFEGITKARPWGSAVGGVIFLIGAPLTMALQQKSLHAKNTENRLARVSIKTRVLDLFLEMDLNRHHRGIARLLITGVTMRLSAYLLSFPYWPPLTVEGRLTCVHIAASVGGSMVFAAVAWFFMAVCKAYKGKWGAVLALTAYLSLFVCFHTSVQDDFAKSAGIQRSFWKQTLNLCPDLEEGAIILVDPEGLPDTHYIHSNFWTDRLILDLMFDFPRGWITPPRLYVLNYQTFQSVRPGPDNTILWDRPVSPPQNTIPSVLEQGKVIFLKMANGRLERQFSPIALGPDLVLDLKPLGPNLLSNLPKRPLFAYMTQY